MGDDPRSALARLEVVNVELLAHNAHLSARCDELAIIADAFQQSPIAQLVVDRDAIICAANAAAAALLGVAASQLVGGRLDAFVATHELAELRRFFDALVERGSASRDLTVAHGAPDTRVTIHANVATSGKHYTCSLVDLGPRERLEQTRHLASMHELAIGIASQLSTLMSTATTNLDVLLEESTDSALAARLADAQLAADRAAELAGKLWAYAGTRTYELRLLEVRQLLQAFETVARIAAGTAQLTIATMLPATVRGDIKALARAILNLVENAGEADAKNVAIAVKAWQLGPGEAAAIERGHALSPGAYIVIEVDDDGHGITPGLRQRIFEPFFSTRASGRGLGLSVAHGVARAHGGTLVLDADRGSRPGSCFRLFVPMLSA